MQDPSSSSPSPSGPGDAAPTLLGPGSAFEGLLTFRGAARIDGRLTGEVVAEGRLWIGPEARVEARIRVDELVVAGSLEGDVEARGRVEIQSTGHVVGSLRTPRLALAEGGRLSGRCAAGGPAAAAPPAPAPGVATVAGRPAGTG